MMSKQSTAPDPKNFGLLSVSGPDAKKFLQGQLTCNVDEVTPSQSRLGAHCNPQGRVLFLFRLFYFQNQYYLVMPSEMISFALGHLEKYAVFYKVTLKSLGPNTLNSELNQLASFEWAYFDVKQGRPQVYTATRGKFLPHDLNLHQLGGISWEKGCYTGQEIIARMQYRGKLKNQLYRVRVLGKTVPAPGAEIHGSQNALVVDCDQEAPQCYQLLIIAHQSEFKSTTFSLDPQQNETWEWLTHSML